ncbi:MAG: class I SAM-dependent methyltransferase [Candidatus Omnitrophica bacterium]|nr:class I SAM-dependent methyltransferase [Candidatus Omnitrophota bacterium]
MATIEENKLVWGDKYDWSNAGEEWSNDWGTSYMQWHGTILPRISAFLPAHTILEIAPGFGRWTEFLKDYCTNLIVLDISEKCIKACRKRFNGCSHITYFVNDGKSLEMIPDNTIDFTFSFDSLVHAEDTTISAYISGLAKKLKQNGVAFIHHSNLGEYSNCLKTQRMISRIPKLLSILIRLGIICDVRDQWRAPSMTAKKMQLYTNKNSLQCISQELITWRTRRALIDCISTIVKKESIWARENKVFKNMYFMEEARNVFNLSQLYGLRSRR